MTPLVLVRTLHDLGVVMTLRPDGEHLHVSAPAGGLNDCLRQALHQHKQALLAMTEWHEERAALCEYGGGLPRDEAERLAWQCVLGDAL
jgi:hypothetical protein